MKIDEKFLFNYFLNVITSLTIKTMTSFSAAFYEIVVNTKHKDSYMPPGKYGCVKVGFKMFIYLI